jgi:hypothetical protein
MKKKLKQLIERVEFWSQDRQNDAAQILIEMEQQDREDYQLTKEQLKEIDRRLSNPNPKFIPYEELRTRFTQRRT